MLAFFPTPYPDEILYSVFARYHIRSGNTSSKWTLQELFGSSSATAIIDLPSNISNLINRLPYNSKYTADEFIHCHTLFPFYSPFLFKEKALLVLDSMKGNKGENIHTRAGIMASGIKTPEHLRFCPSCYQEDIKLFGEPYWHRLHQVPGVMVCPVHNVELQNSKIYVPGLNKHLFYAAGEDNCIYHPRTLRFNINTLEKLVVLAKDINWLINQHLSYYKLGFYQEKYKNLLIEKGYSTPNGRVYQKQLLDDFISYYGIDFLEAVQSLINYEKEQNWLTSIVRKHRKSFHPLRHLLIIRFLANLHIPERIGHLFRKQPIIHSIFTWTPIPETIGH